MDFVKLTPTPLLQGLLAGSVLVQTVVYLALGLRFWCRRLTRAPLAWDDGLAVLSAVGGTAMLICVGLFTTAGLGYTQEAIDQNGAHENYKLIKQLVFVYEILYHVTISTAKLSALTFYLRIFSASAGRGAYIAVIVSMVVIVVQTLAIMIWGITICIPPSELWATADPDFCGNRRPMYLAASIFAILTDFLIIGLPIPVVWKLKMKRSKKQAVVALFATGIFMTIASIVRILSTTWIKEDDTPRTAPYFMFFSHVEPSVACLCVCIPLLNPFFSRVFGNKFFGSRSGSKVTPSGVAIPTHTIGGSKQTRQHDGFSRLDGSGERFEMRSQGGGEKKLGTGEIVVMSAIHIKSETRPTTGEGSGDSGSESDLVLPVQKMGRGM